MARRSQHSLEEIKDMVLKAAETIVEEEGFPALKVRKIALEIGYTVGSIYMVFDNMADLIRHVKGHTLDDLARELDRVQEGDDVERCVGELAKAYLAFASRNKNRWSMIFEQCQQEEGEVPQWYKEKANRMFTRIEALFARLSPERSAEQNRTAARALWSGVHGVCMLSLTGKLELVGAGDIEQVVETLVDNFLLGWTGKAGNSR